MLIVSSFEDELSVDTVMQLRSLLARRDPKLKANAFMIAPASSEFPQLGIFVRNHEAVLQYMAKNGNFISKAGNPAANASFMTFFENSAGTEIQLPMDAVVPESDAITAAIQFFESIALPTAVEWLEI